MAPIMELQPTGRLFVDVYKARSQNENFGILKIALAFIVTWPPGHLKPELQKLWASGISLKRALKV